MKRANLTIPAVLLCLILANTAPAGETEIEKRPGHSLGLPYPDSVYRDDRRGTGPYFRDIRAVREKQGIEAGIDALGSQYKRFRKDYSDTWHEPHLLDEWGFWAWHEAQFDSGKNDPEWSKAIYLWILDEARRSGRVDWVFHVSVPVLFAYSSTSHWSEHRLLLDEMSASLKRGGLDVDPDHYPEIRPWNEAIPEVKLRRFPSMLPNGRHVVHWLRRDQKDASKPMWMDRMTSAHLLAVANKHLQQGDWRKSIELGLWVTTSAAAITEYNQGRPSREQIPREQQCMCLAAAKTVAAALQLLNLHEEEARWIQESLDKDLPPDRNGATFKRSLTSRLLELRQMFGECSEDFLAEIDQQIEDTRKHYSDLGAVDITLVKVCCLDSLGRQAEASEILDQLRQLTARKYGSWLAVELCHVDRCLDRGDLAEAGKLLPELLELMRKDGIKINELSLYMRYVRWAELSGDTGLAVYCQRELVRLLEAFRLSPRLPLAYAKLSSLLAKLAETTESADLMKKALTLAAAPDLPGRIQEAVRKIASEIPAPATTKERQTRVLLQPGNAMSMAADGFPARLMLQVVNTSNTRARGQLRITGAGGELQWDAASRHGQWAATDGSNAAPVAMEVDTQSMALIHCRADSVPEEGMIVRAEWLEDDEVTTSAEWTVKPADQSSNQAVIDAGIYHDNRFCLIPVYHHLQAADRELANLRIITSAPCRVELYDESGQLRMVDATGNGSCFDGGDWLAADLDGDGSAELQPHPDNGETRFHLFIEPADAVPEGGLMIKTEWRIDGNWIPAAEDRIVNHAPTHR